MQNKECLYELLYSNFKSSYSFEKGCNSDFVLTVDYILQWLNEVKNNPKAKMLFDKYGQLTTQEEQNIVNTIKSIYTVHQDEGKAILGDYEHDYNWYNNLLRNEKYNEYYWTRYKHHLINKNFPEKVIDTLENDTLKKIMSYLGNPTANEQFAIRGLVIGDVQSGKTSNYLGLITKAADAGYKVIFILTGTIESLRRQTQIRVEEGFIGFDSVNGEDVGVNRGSKVPMAFTSRNSDFKKIGTNNTTFKISDATSEPMIFVIKKNVPVLKAVYSSLKRINTKNDEDKINFPMIMIDDEADNASINTNNIDNDPTKINKYIRDILALFTKNSYVGFTATPFANVFIAYDEADEMLKNDLFPKDFIYALNTPTNYCGSKMYFEKENENVRYIEDASDLIFPLKHKSDYVPKELFGSLYHSINTFFLANAIRDIRDINKFTHRSMLINISRFTNVQNVIKTIVEEYVARVKRELKLCMKIGYEESLKNYCISDLKKSFEIEYSNIFAGTSKLEFKDVLHNMYDSINKIKVVVVNSSKNSEKLNYDEERNGGRVIAIGGLALSRGLTLEGLCVSYFYRNTATFDVLMQMGRWFGYRMGYEDLCRIFITEKSAVYYKEICNSIEQLKNDIFTMALENKKPTDYGIRVLNNSQELDITAPNKRKHTTQKYDQKEFYGSVFDTPYLSRDLKNNNNNIEATFELLNKLSVVNLDTSVRNHPYCRNIPKQYIIDLLRKINIPSANSNFDTNQILTFLENNDDEFFDVLIVGGESENVTQIESLNYAVHHIKRVFNLYVGRDNNDVLVRISGMSAHLLGRGDTQLGLTKEEIKNIEGNNGKLGAKEYMVDRLPLLIIYFINIWEGRGNNSLQGNEKEFANELNNSKYNFLVGFAMGFPKKNGAVVKREKYFVNTTVNYYDKEHDEGGISDE